MIAVPTSTVEPWLPRIDLGALLAALVADIDADTLTELRAVAVAAAGGTITAVHGLVALTAAVASRRTFRRAAAAAYDTAWSLDPVAFDMAQDWLAGVAISIRIRAVSDVDRTTPSAHPIAGRGPLLEVAPALRHLPLLDLAGEVACTQPGARLMVEAHALRGAVLGYYERLDDHALIVLDPDAIRRTGTNDDVAFAHELAHAMDPLLDDCDRRSGEVFADTLAEDLLRERPRSLADAAPLIARALRHVQRTPATRAEDVDALLFLCSLPIAATCDPLVAGGAESPDTTLHSFLQGDPPASADGRRPSNRLQVAARRPVSPLGVARRHSDPVDAP